MVTVGKHINCITINPLEYLFGDDGGVVELVSEDAGKAFLKEKGFTGDNIYWLVFEPVQEGE